MSVCVVFALEMCVGICVICLQMTIMYPAISLKVRCAQCCFVSRTCGHTHPTAHRLFGEWSWVSFPGIVLVELPACGSRFVSHLRPVAAMRWRRVPAHVSLQRGVCGRRRRGLARLSRVVRLLGSFFSNPHISCNRCRIAMTQKEHWFFRPFSS